MNAARLAEAIDEARPGSLKALLAKAKLAGDVSVLNSLGWPVERVMMATLAAPVAENTSAMERAAFVDPPAVAELFEVAVGSKESVKTSVLGYADCVAFAMRATPLLNLDTGSELVGKLSDFMISAAFGQSAFLGV